MTMIPLFNTNGVSTCPLGMPMSQNRLAVPFWSYAMEMLPPKRIIELGTGDGGLATALGLHARIIGATVVTYDRARPNERIAPTGRLLGVDFRTVADLWRHEAEIAKLIAAPGRTFMLCDGGDKPRELATFARYLKSGDVIAAHDYDADHARDPAIPNESRSWPWSEITAMQGAAVAAEHGLVPFLQAHFDHIGWLAYQKR